MTETSGAVRFVDATRRLPGVAPADPAPLREIERLEAHVGARLPALHRDLLLASNGLSANWGYLRIYGVGKGAHAIDRWNRPETWKFAWRQPLDGYLTFAGTGWGDQYAYRIADLRRGVEAVERLDCHLMEPADVPVADDFAGFLRAFRAFAREPRPEVADARRQVGDLRADELALRSPSPLLVGIERATRLMKMSARGTMTVNGDIATQLLDPANEGRVVDQLEAYEDDLGRLRIRVGWKAGTPEPPGPAAPAGPAQPPEA